jgi:hypothetical protein
VRDFDGNITEFYEAAPQVSKGRRK